MERRMKARTLSSEHGSPGTRLRVREAPGGFATGVPTQWVVGDVSPIK